MEEKSRSQLFLSFKPFGTALNAPCAALVSLSEPILVFFIDVHFIDEFDVFMDAVNRRTSMRLLTETANASNKKQYIFITPQDMNNVVLGPSVRVLRMSDPERGNGTLSFASSST